MKSVSVSTRIKDFVIVPYVSKGLWDGVHWVTLSDLDFTIKMTEYGVEIKRTLRAGFVTDFGSIPKALRLAVDRMGKGLIPFVIHDYMYCEPNLITRKLADQMLGELCLHYHVGHFKSRAIYHAVRAFGWQHYGKTYIHQVRISSRALDAIVDSHQYLKEKIKSEKIHCADCDSFLADSLPTDTRKLISSN